MCRKMILRTVLLPVGLTLNVIANAWAFLNQILFAQGEFVIWHWRDKNRRHGNFLVMPLKRDQKKFRYRAFTLANKLRSVDQNRFYERTGDYQKFIFERK